jgi:uncharacterized protein (DUF2336 family)
VAEVNMTANAARSLMTELDQTLNSASDERQRAILRKVTELFIGRSEEYSGDQLALFDDVMFRLIETSEHSALIELSSKLAPVGNAPLNVVLKLSKEDDIAISGPILEKSVVVPDETLAEIAKTKGQNHLAAIAKRASINQDVSDILVDRGNSEVACRVTGNHSHRLSELSFVKLMKRARNDKALADAVAIVDVPPNVLTRLAYDDDFTIAAPILERSNVLTPQVLADIAKTKGIRHLFAIGSRPELPESVADILVERGNTDLMRRMAGNERIKFSETGFARMINAAKGDKVLASIIATRSDIPPELQPFLKLALG